MRRTFMLTAALTVALIATSVTAQNAIRCEVGGKVVYGDSACPPGSTAKAIAPTQDTAEQRAAGKAANDQIRKDTVAVDKRMDDRYTRETARPVVAETKTSSTTKRTKPKASKAMLAADAEPKRGGFAKSKKGKSATKAGTKQDGKSSRPAPKP